MWRGTDGRLYPWGNEFRRDPFREAADTRLREVISLPERRSPYGLYHMNGNVAEWVADAGDPAAATRVVLGRSWSSEADLVRHDARIGDPADRRAPEIGFRLVAERVTAP
jgi:formylglycine-generating enzyme required for sulfatase activity